MKPGLTYLHLSRMFRVGYSIADIAKRKDCTILTVEHALRVVLRRESPRSKRQ